MKTVAVSGHFNPLHTGHLLLFNSAKRLGDRLVVIVSNDEQVEMKRGFEFIPLIHRMALIRAIKGVDEVVASIDKTRSVARTLALIKPDIFASGCTADHPDAIEEKMICDEMGIQMVFNIGGDKFMSSSDLINKVYENTSFKTKYRRERKAVRQGSDR